MNILAIHSGHNATVAYFEDGVCKKVLQEEKFSNIKNHGGFPHAALDYLAARYDFSRVDFVTFPYTEILWLNTPNEGAGNRPGSGTTIYEGNALEKLSRGSALRKVWDWMEYYLPFKRFFFHLRNLIIRVFITPGARKAVSAYLLKKYGFKEGQIRYYDHHYSHGVSTLYFFNLKELDKDVLIFSMDGAGDRKFAKVFVYRKGAKDLETISESDFTASIGLLYSGVTDYLGMKPNEHEYKVMGLAAYVSEEKYYKKPYQDLSGIISLDEKSLKFRSKFNTNLTGTSNMFLKDHMQRVRFDNLSAAMQKMTEELVIRWIKAGIKNTGIKTAVCTGGVFMNVKMNQKIQDMPEIEKIYFMPSCGDESTVLGSPAAVYYEKGEKTSSDASMYKGHEYTSDEAIKFLKEKGYDRKYSVRKCGDIEKETALLLKDFKIVARFKGACEWGARSLCNRAILGNASDLRTFYEVNDMIKMRDFWMPFAPTLLGEWAGKYIKNWDTLKNKVSESSRYMITAFDSTPLALQHLRASIHQKDKTLRPQVVWKDDNPDLYKLLKYYEEMTGMGGLMNTSLNIHGYPLVGTLEQAMFTLENSGLEYMTIEDLLIQKKSPDFSRG